MDAEPGRKRRKGSRTLAEEVAEFANPQPAYQGKRMKNLRQEEMLVWLLDVWWFAVQCRW